MAKAAAIGWSSRSQSGAHGAKAKTPAATGINITL